MPRLDGLEVCRQLRRLPECAHTRIVMLTAAAQAADRRRGIEAGADHYLTKPLSPPALLTLLRGLVAEASGLAGQEGSSQRSPTPATSKRSTTTRRRPNRR